MKNIILIIWRWLKDKFQNPVNDDLIFNQDLPRAERRKAERYKNKYSGKRSFTKAPTKDYIITPKIYDIDKIVFLK